MLKTRLKTQGAAKYMPDFPILKPKADRVQMRLILGTHHVQGIEVFRNVSKKLEAVQAETRREIAGNGSPQPSFFSSQDLTEMDLDGRGVGGPKSRKHAASVCREVMAPIYHAVKFEQLAAQIMEVAYVRMTDVKDIAVELRAEGFLRFDLPGRAKKPNEETLIWRSRP